LFFLLLKQPAVSTLSMGTQKPWRSASGSSLSAAAGRRTAPGRFGANDLHGGEPHVRRSDQPNSLVGVDSNGLEVRNSLL